MHVIWFTLLPLLALILDLALGDPRGLPHPVTGIGKLAGFLESWGRRLAPGSLFLWGLGCTLVLACGAAALAQVLSALPWIGWLIALYLAWSGLALRGLLSEGRLDEAREALAGLVTRDTSALDALGLRRALAESVSENLNDGFVAPFFWLCLLGPGGLWFAKAVSTLDSMWGYRTPEYERLGKAAARLDDLLAWIPARLTALALVLAGAVMDLDWKGAKAHVSADAARTESPNAGWPMAAAAWLLGARVGGPAVYFGAAKDKPWLGPGGGFWDEDKLETLLQLCMLAAMVAALLEFLVLRPAAAMLF